MLCKEVTLRYFGIGWLWCQFKSYLVFTVLLSKMDLPCNECGVMVKKKNMNRHILTHREATIKCNLCDKTFRTKDSLNQHLKTHEKPVEIKCTMCTGVFYSKSSLNSHIKAKHEKIRHLCPYCKKRFYISRLLYKTY